MKAGRSLQTIFQELIVNCVYMLSLLREKAKPWLVKWETQNSDESHRRFDL